MRQIRVNVRTLVEFSYLSGSLVPASRAMKRMQEGMQAHVLRQRSYPEGWQSEVSVSRTVEACGLSITVHGRIDGLGTRDGHPLIEEIKSTADEPSLLSEDTLVHRMQAVVYAALLDSDEIIDVDIVYVNGSREKRFSYRLSREDRERHFDEAVFLFAREAARRLDAREHARETAKEICFPYDACRSGQEKMLRHVRYALQNSRLLMVQAPTGIGKTMGTLYPALKSFAEGEAERIFYLTARTTQRRAAEEALALLRSRGLFMRAVTITAKEKICFCPDGVCSGSMCAYADGYFDRIGGALSDSVGLEVFDREGIEALAQKHMVCPFELSLELAEQAEAVICDYNYAFDPNVRLKRFFDAKKNKAILLVDEAHELPDRVNNMLSAELRSQMVRKARSIMGKAVGKDSPAYGALTELLEALLQLRTEEDYICESVPETLLSAMERAGEVLREYMPFPDPVVSDVYFALLDMIRCAGRYDAGHSYILVSCGKTSCAVWFRRFDPSAHIRETLLKCRSAVLFSATLTPLKHYAALCGLYKDKGDALLSVEGPFPKENRLVLSAPVSMRYKDRERSLPMAAAYIDAMVRGETGNYIVFCPSYAVLQQLADVYEALYPGPAVLRQQAAMPEEARTQMLAVFVPAPAHTTVLFAVLGGIFAEGIDLPGDRLIGTAIVSVGLPQFGLERDTLASREPPAGGYEAAYIYPSVSRVAQAAGRLIRTETDKGVLMLIDDRFAVRPYTMLYEKLWHPRPAGNPDRAAVTVREFWERGGRAVDEDDEWYDAP